MIRLLPLVALLALATPAAALDCEPGFRPFAHAAGEDCIPMDPQRIVTLQDQNGLLPLMELGVAPVGSMGYLQPDGTEIFRRMDGYDTSGIRWLGSYRGPFDVEAVAAMRPDLIIASPFPEGAWDPLRAVAPVVVIDMFNQPMNIALMQFADIVDRTDRAVALRDTFEARAKDVRATLGPALQNTTAAFVNYRTDEEQFYGVPPTQAMGMVFAALEPRRPVPEQGLGPRSERKSMETIGDHAADVMFQMVYDVEHGNNSDSHAAFLAQPLVGTMAVARANQIVPLDGAEIVGSAWGKATIGLDRIADVLLREDLNRDLVIE